MIRLFQVNTGVYLQLNRDVPPTALVRDICSAVESVSGEDALNQVMLTAEGQQMDPDRVIGSYPTGTDSKPIFLFFKTYLNSVGPPSAPSHVEPSSGLQRQLELLQLKPSPSMFQHQTALAKLLGEYASDLGSASVQIACEYGLQIAGWEAVLKNCSNIVRVYQKHHQLFCRTVESFQLSQQHYLNLLDKFPEQVRLLQDLPLPPGHTAHSLYEWISTHDEKNSLEDLSTECEKALAQVKSEPIHAAITTSENILAGADLSLSQTQPFRQLHSHLKELASTASQLAAIQNSLSENVQSTSQRALRSGDAGTIADLVISHHSSLQLMSQQNIQLEGIVREMESTKDKLQGHLHSALCSVTDLQMRLAESNSHLMLLYEHVKLAQRRFNVLEQVSSTPDVLAQVVAEVEQRRAFRDTLHQKAAALSSAISRAREEERGRRRSFLASYGQHFVTTLFPELQTKTPELTVQLSGALPSDCADLSKIKHLLPSFAGWSPASVAFLASTSDQTSHCMDTATQTDGTHLNTATQTDGTHLDTATQTDGTHLDTATQTDGTHLDTATQTDGTHLDTATQLDSKYLSTAVQTGSQCLEETRELWVRVRELEDQLEVEKGERARQEELLGTESKQRLQEIKRLEALCQQYNCEVTALRQEADRYQSQLSKAQQQYEMKLSGLEQCSREQAKELERSRVLHQQAQEVVGGRLELIKGRVHDLEEEREGLRGRLELTEGRVHDLEEEREGLRKRLELSEGRVHDLEEEREGLRGRLELTKGRVHDLEEEREGLRKRLELSEGRVHDLEEEKESALEGVERERKKVEEMEHQLQQERDSHLKFSMELEREVKELRRAVVGVEPPATTQDSQKPQASRAVACLVDKITICNLQVGDVALFMTDAHGNYLALSVDGKTYYLNHSCVSSFSEYLSSKAQHLNLKRKLLLGRITERTFVEVRKEGNRLHVPVGSRLYKVHAEEVVTM